MHTEPRSTRRRFLRTAAGAAGLALCHDALLGVDETPAGKKLPEPSASRLPRWRGFNLLEKFTERHNAPFREADFELMAEWGFDFVRLPLSYRCWSTPERWRELDEKVLKHIDEAVELGGRYGVHVDINFHRAPGYCVNPPAEPFDLFADETALEAASHHWAHFAKRYKGIPNSRVSFDLLNEPSAATEEAYVRVMKRLIEVIRAEDPDRLIIVDGLKWGRDPVPSLVGLGVAQSTRGYDPMGISHYRASWVRGSDSWPVPTWPLRRGERDVWDRERLRRERIAPWKALEAQGVGVHVGEWGAHQRTPHAVALAWMGDCLHLWKAAGWGWALWNLRGSFGILDSGREDVEYESFKGHKLDRKMLELLRAG